MTNFKMTDFEQKIYEVIANSDGIKGAQIANIINVEKSLVNSTLYRSSALKERVKQDKDYKWHLVDKHDDGNGLISNHDNDLMKLCNYYLQCISMESSSSVSQFLSSKFDNYNYDHLQVLMLILCNKHFGIAHSSPN